MANTHKRTTHQTSIRLTPEAEQIQAEFSQQLGIDRTAVIELALRSFAGMDVMRVKTLATLIRQVRQAGRAGPARKVRAKVNDGKRRTTGEGEQQGAGGQLQP